MKLLTADKRAIAPAITRLKFFIIYNLRYRSFSLENASLILTNDIISPNVIVVNKVTITVTFF